MTPSELYPTGAVTVVFTDIEGYSILEGQYGSALQPVLDEHNHLLRDALLRHNGMEVRIVGDAFFITFARPSDAVQFAVDAQHRLVEREWSVSPSREVEATTITLRVRMGMHTGEARVLRHPSGQVDYFGTAVNLAARIGAAGHGGQILASEATRLLASPQLPSGITFEDLGRHRLKGVGEEHIWQVCHSDLRCEFPALETLNPQRHNLPLAPTPFIGREEQLREWIELLHQPDTRLVTVIGFGGMGKTRTALQLATLCLKNFSAGFPQGVWWVELEEARSGDAMISRIAESLSFQLQPQPSAREQLWSFLRERQALLVLDNLEQIPDAAAIVNEMLKAAPRLKCVATSRRALNLQIERQVEVPPLPLDEAVLLFGQRAQSRRTAFPPGGDAAKNAETEADIRELCRRLEGVPLAIELAASRSAAMTPREMAGRLNDRFRLLQSRAPDLPPRQRALRGAIDWSHELLGAEDRLLFAQLSVFVGGFTLAEAEAACDAFDVFEGVQELWSQSLLSTSTGLDQTTRYLMLESLRDYAGEKLGDMPEVEATVRRRHLDYFLEFACERMARLRTANEAAALREMEAAADNVRVAMDWAEQQQEYLLCARLALALGTWLQRRGLQQEAITRFTTGLEAVDRLPDEGRSTAAEMLRERGGVHLDRHEWAAARSAANESLAVFESIGDARGVAQARNLLGWVAEGEGDFNGARAHFVAALQGFESCGDGLGIANVRNNLGGLEFQDPQGDKVEAGRHFQAALQLLRGAGDARGIAAALTNLGAIAFEAGRVDEASERYREALRFQRELCDVSGIASSLFNLGEAVERKGRQEDAQGDGQRDKRQTRHAYRLLAAAEHLFDEVGSPYKSFAREFCARIAADLGYASAALDALQRNLRAKSLDDLLAWALPENS